MKGNVYKSHPFTGSLPLLGFDITKEGVKEGFKIFKRNTTAIEPTIYKAENETENEKSVSFGELRGG